MANVTDYDTSTSFVFALDTTPGDALQIHAAVAKFAPTASLRASPDQKRLYGYDCGVEYAELDSGEPVQAALKKMSDARRASIASLRSQGYFLCVEFVGVVFISIVLSTIGVGVASEIGKDLWTGVKTVLKRLWHRLRQKPSELERLFADLDVRLHDETVSDLVVVLQVTNLWQSRRLVTRQVRHTFLVDPGLPKKAIRQAERLRPKHNYLDVPLRWHRDRNRWLPDMDAIRSEEALRELRADMRKFARSRRTSTGR